MSEEKRMHKRTDLNTKLTLSIIKHVNGRDLEPFEVEITDVSTTGIGFKTDNQLMIGEMFNGELKIWTKQRMPVVLKIVRSAIEEEGYSYGSIFVGLQNNDSNSIFIYQLLNEK